MKAQQEGAAGKEPAGIGGNYCRRVTQALGGNGLTIERMPALDRLLLAPLGAATGQALVAEVKEDEKKGGGSWRRPLRDYIPRPAVVESACNTVSGRPEVKDVTANRERGLSRGSVARRKAVVCVIDIGR
jgi:hypothetical protein